MKTALVTGASRGIGKGIAMALSAAGYQVAVHFNHNRDAAVGTAEQCVAAGPSGSRPAGELVFQADISKPEDRLRLVEEVFDALGPIDALVNNAGVAPRVRADILDATEESFDEVIRVNLNGPYFLTQLVARRWLAIPERGIRRIVFVTSVSADMVSTGRGEYCVSKAGLSMAASLFAARLAGEDIPVFEVRPGIIATDMTSGVKEKYDRLIAEGLVPQGRWGSPEDVGETVAAIVDGLLDFCAGSVIHPDGGLHIPRL